MQTPTAGRVAGTENLQAEGLEPRLIVDYYVTMETQYIGVLTYQGVEAQRQA